MYMSNGVELWEHKKTAVAIDHKITMPHHGERVM